MKSLHFVNDSDGLPFVAASILVDCFGDELQIGTTFAIRTFPNPTSFDFPVCLQTWFSAHQFAEPDFDL